MRLPEEGIKGYPRNLRARKIMVLYGCPRIDTTLPIRAFAGHKFPFERINTAGPLKYSRGQGAVHSMELRGYAFGTFEKMSFVNDIGGKIEIMKVGNKLPSFVGLSNRRSPMQMDSIKFCSTHLSISTVRVDICRISVFTMPSIVSFPWFPTRDCILRNSHRLCCPQYSGDEKTGSSLNLVCRYEKKRSREVCHGLKPRNLLGQILFNKYFLVASHCF